MIIDTNPCYNAQNNNFFFLEKYSCVPPLYSNNYEALKMETHDYISDGKRKLKINSLMEVNSGEIVKDRWKIIRKIGGGGFGDIYEAIDLSDQSNQRVAVKIEPLVCLSSHPKNIPNDFLMPLAPSKQVLKMEVYVLKRLQNKPNFCKLYGCGRNERYSYMVMSLKGKNLAQLRRLRPGCCFSPETVVLVAKQILRAIESIHEAGFLHRDIKPSNFAISSDSTLFDSLSSWPRKSDKTYARDKTIYALDFGLSRQYTDVTGKPRAPRSAAGFRGTVRYASLNAHKNKDLCRVDDMWSFFYVLVELSLGYLPWRKIKDKDQVARLKENCNFYELLVNPPNSDTKRRYRSNTDLHCNNTSSNTFIELFFLYQYLTELTDYYDVPDYKVISNLFDDWMMRLGITDDHLYDWEENGPVSPDRSNRQHSIDANIGANCTTNDLVKIGIRNGNQNATSPIDTNRLKNGLSPLNVNSLAMKSIGDKKGLTTSTKALIISDNGEADEEMNDKSSHSDRFKALKKIDSFNPSPQITKTTTYNTNTQPKAYVTIKQQQRAMEQPKIKNAAVLLQTQYINLTNDSNSIPNKSKNITPKTTKHERLIYLPGSTTTEHKVGKSNSLPVYTNNFNNKNMIDFNFQDNNVNHISKILKHCELGDQDIKNDNHESIPCANIQNTHQTDNCDNIAQQIHYLQQPICANSTFDASHENMANLMDKPKNISSSPTSNPSVSQNIYVINNDWVYTNMNTKLPPSPKARNKSLGHDTHNQLPLDIMTHSCPNGDDFYRCHFQPQRISILPSNVQSNKYTYDKSQKENTDCQNTCLLRPKPPKSLHRVFYLNMNGTKPNKSVNDTCKDFPIRPDTKSISGGYDSGRGDSSVILSAKPSGELPTNMDSHCLALDVDNKARYLHKQHSRRLKQSRFNKNNNNGNNEHKDDRNLISNMRSNDNNQLGITDEPYQRSLTEMDRIKDSNSPRHLRNNYSSSLLSSPSTQLSFENEKDVSSAYNIYSPYHNINMDNNVVNTCTTRQNLTVNLPTYKNTRKEILSNRFQNETNNHAGFNNINIDNQYQKYVWERGGYLNGTHHNTNSFSNDELQHFHSNENINSDNYENDVIYEHANIADFKANDDSFAGNGIIGLDNEEDMVTKIDPKWGHVTIDPKPGHNCSLAHFKRYKHKHQPVHVSHEKNRGNINCNDTNETNTYDDRYLEYKDKSNNLVLNNPILLRAERGNHDLSKSKFSTIKTYDEIRSLNKVVGISGSNVRDKIARFNRKSNPEIVVTKAGKVSSPHRTSNLSRHSSPVILATGIFSQYKNSTNMNNENDQGSKSFVILPKQQTLIITKPKNNFAPTLNQQSLTIKN